MRRISAILLLCGLFSPLWADSPSGERPEWCKSGYICLTTKSAADMLIKVDMLQEQNAILKSKKAHAIGWAAVCGPAASLSSTAGNTTFAGTVSCVVGYGFKF